MKANPIDSWSDEMVEKIFVYALDEMWSQQREIVEGKYTTVEQKRSYLIEQEKKFENSCK